MKYLGSKDLETKRLILKAQSMNEQKRLWEILMMPCVNDVYLTTNPKYREKLKDWNIQEKFYKSKIEKASNNDVFEWSIFLKSDETICIGKIDFHEYGNEDESFSDKSIRGVGWYIDPNYQGQGYATEAVKVTLDYMFNQVGITEIRTGAAITNVASWKLMEKFGFVREKETYYVLYTYKEAPVEDYRYILTKARYYNFNKSSTNNK